MKVFLLRKEPQKINLVDIGFCHQIASRYAIVSRRKHLGLPPLIFLENRSSESSTLREARGVYRGPSTFNIYVSTPWLWSSRGRESSGPQNRHTLLQSRSIIHFASLISRVIQTSMKWSIGMHVRNSNPPVIGFRPLTMYRTRETRDVYRGDLSLPSLRSVMEGESRGPLNRHQEQETSRKIVSLQSRFITHPIGVRPLTMYSAHVHRTRETREVYRGDLSLPSLWSSRGGVSRGPLNRHQEQETSRNIVLLQSRFITHFASLVSRIFRTSVKSSIGMLVRNSNPPAIGVQPLTTQQPESLGEVIQTNLFITHTRYESREWELAKLQSARMANPFSNLSMIGLTNREPAAYKRGFPHPTMQDNKAFSEDTSSIYHAPAMELVKPYEESTRAHNQSTKYNKAETNSAYSQGQSPILDINRLTDQVYQAIERKIRIERERRGL